MQVAKAYGMIQPGASDTSAVRATFIIDPEGILRAMVYYPMTNGRSIDEFVRLVTALQTSDANACATPENWQPGEKVIVPPPGTQDDAEERLVLALVCFQAALRPAVGAGRGLQHLVARGRARPHGLVEADRDVRAQRLLHGDGVLGRVVDERTVEV